MVFSYQRRRKAIWNILKYIEYFKISEHDPEFLHLLRDKAVHVDPNPFGEQYSSSKRERNDSLANSKK